MPPRFRKLLLLSLLLLLTLACQTITQGLRFSETPTPFIPTPTAVVSVEVDTSLQLEIFEELWTTINQQYLYPDFNGVDWDAVGDEYRARIEAGLTPDEFYLAMNEMISRLGDEHSAFLSPEQVAAEEAELAGNLDYAGIGIYSTITRANDAMVILVVFPNSPAEEAGLKAHDVILEVDGIPIVDENGALREVIRGPEGTDVTLLVRSPGAEPRTLTITRRRISGAVPVNYQVLTTPSGKRVGYILIPTFSDGTVADQVGAALEDMSREAPLDGLIFDNRINEGGVDTMLKDTLGYFIDGPAGTFISRHDERPLTIQGVDVAGSQTIPLVVMVGLDTISYGEVFAGVLKDLGRAYLIGETTDGNVETLWGYDFDDGSRAWIAHDSFRPLNHPDQDWEETGIIPDLFLPVLWEEVTFETDPAIQAAVEYLDGP
ncbi:MAG: S41 family peptidase [Anaerolineales bacterium]